MCLCFCYLDTLFEPFSIVRLSGLHCTELPVKLPACLLFEHEFVFGCILSSAVLAQLRCTNDWSNHLVIVCVKSFQGYQLCNPLFFFCRCLSNMFMSKHFLKSHMKHLWQLQRLGRLSLPKGLFTFINPRFVYFITVPEFRVCPFFNEQKAQKSSDGAKIMSTLI